MYKSKITGASPPIIRDIIVAAQSQGKTPTGEYGYPNQFGGRAAPKTENQNDLINRLYNYIEGLAIWVSEKHRTNNCISTGNQLKPSNLNNITRMITNEFFFYTNKPLTIKEFEKLQQKIIVLAKNQPENLHLVLASFAVKTPNNEVMNIVAHLECGPYSKINFIVKNNISNIDPVYHEQNKNGLLYPLPNASIENTNISFLNIRIDNQPHYFTFNNIFECKTAGDQLFFSCIDICIDFVCKVAKTNFQAYLLKIKEDILKNKRKELIPIYYSHVITSNSLSTDRGEPFGDGPPTHADPIWSHIQVKANAYVESTKTLQETALSSIIFGTPANIITTSPTPCNKLSSSIIQDIEKINLSIDTTLEKSTTKLQDRLPPISSIKAKLLHPMPRSTEEISAIVKRRVEQYNQFMSAKKLKLNP